LTAKSVERSIRIVRGQRVMLDADLALIYGVPTKALNLAVKRNAKRFPADFRFRLSIRELDVLRFQNETSKNGEGRGGRRYQPWVFTQEGVAMLSAVLRSAKAIAVNVEIMRAFVRMREAMAASTELTRRLAQLEAEMERHAAVLGQHKAETTQALRSVFEALRQLAVEAPEAERPARRVGFVLDRAQGG
jgi:phage regulator Rha-like protein